MGALGHLSTKALAGQCSRGLKPRAEGKPRERRAYPPGGPLAGTIGENKDCIPDPWFGILNDVPERAAQATLEGEADHVEVAG